MPREYVALLMAEMLPLLEGTRPLRIPRLFKARLTVWCRTTSNNNWTKRFIWNPSCGRRLHFDQRIVSQRVRFVGTGLPSQRCRKHWIIIPELARFNAAELFSNGYCRPISGEGNWHYRSTIYYKL